MPKTIRVIIAILFVAVLNLRIGACTGSAKAEAVCYGQHRPICGLGQKPVCVCSGDIGQNCSYVCMPK